LECEEAHIAEERLEDGGGDVGPVEHDLEFGRVLHVTLEGRQEDLRRVTEDDDAQRDGEVFEVESPFDLAPAPFRQFQKAVAEDDRVDKQVRHRAPKAQQRHHVQTLQEAEGKQQDTADHHPGACVDWTFGEGAHLKRFSHD
jgi:hypothetical protein